MSMEEILEAIQSGDERRVNALLAMSPKLASERTDQGVSLVLHSMYFQKPDIARIIGSVKPSLDAFEAVALGDGDRLTELLASSAAALEEESPDGFRLLHYAAFFGNEEAAQTLLERGAQVAVPAGNPMKVHALHSAAAIQSVAICRALLEAGADANAPQHSGFTALMSAAMHGNLELIELLVKHGADVSISSDEGKTALKFATEAGHADAVAMLSECD